MDDTIRMQLPTDATSITVDAVAYEPDDTGCVRVPASTEAACLRAGCVQVGDAGDAEATTAAPKRRKVGV